MIRSNVGRRPFFFDLLSFNLLLGPVFAMEITEWCEGSVGRRPFFRFGLPFDLLVKLVFATEISEKCKRRKLNSKLFLQLRIIMRSNGTCPNMFWAILKGKQIYLNDTVRKCVDECNYLEWFLYILIWSFGLQYECMFMIQIGEGCMNDCWKRF